MDIAKCIGLRGVSLEISVKDLERPLMIYTRSELKLLANSNSSFTDHGSAIVGSAIVGDR